MENSVKELSELEIAEISGGFDGKVFLTGLGLAALGAAAVAAAPLVATATALGAVTAWGIGASGGVLGVGGAGLMGLSFAISHE